MSRGNLKKRYQRQCETLYADNVRLRRYAWALEENYDYMSFALEDAHEEVARLEALRSDAVHVPAAESEGELLDS